MGSAIRLPSSYSFPSGHAATGIAVFGLLGLLAATASHTRRRRVAAIGVGFVIGALIGASRVVLNVDYASDVLAGAALGLAWLAFCLFVNRHRRRRGGAPPPAREASPAHGDMSARRPAGRIALVAVTDDRPVADQLAELGAQLAWVRDYL